MKFMKFWPFEVVDDAEECGQQFPPLELLYPRIAIVGLASGFAGALIVLLGFHHW
jgi:hypothetical protein